MNLHLVVLLKQLFADKGHTFFDGKIPYNLNIIGVRSPERVAGKFDDKILLVHRDDKHKWQWHEFKATTDTGEFYLRQPLSKDGTAIILPNQYKGVYKLGIHGRTWASGGYKALEQVKNFTYIRDNNRDNVLDIDNIDLNAIFEANLKTNLHRASKWQILDFIGKYSAGCQVIQDPKDFDILINACEQSIERGLPNSFTYTLINEEDLVKYGIC